MEKKHQHQIALKFQLTKKKKRELQISLKSIGNYLISRRHWDSFMSEPNIAINVISEQREKNAKI